MVISLYAYISLTLEYYQLIICTQRVQEASTYTLQDRNLQNVLETTKQKKFNLYSTLYKITTCLAKLLIKSYNTKISDLLFLSFLNYK